MITTFATLEVNVTTTSSTFTTSAEVTTTFDNVSQDANLTNNTVTGLGKS